MRVGVTPYPAIMLSYYMAAIDSVESGVKILNDWLAQYQHDYYDITLTLNPQLGWYQVRVMLAESQLPFFFGGFAPNHRAAVNYQKKMTDKLATLLGVGSADTWDRFCRRLDARTMNNQIGKLLAFIYVTERFYLFKLLGPDDFWNSDEDYGLSSVDSPPSRFVSEARAMLKSADCLSGVDDFDEHRDQYTGMFHLYIGQLKIAEYQRSAGGNRDELLGQIRSELTLAESLGESPGLGLVPGTVTVTTGTASELLGKPDDFDPDRERLIQLKDWLKKIRAAS
jgi:hypothetical protein